MKPIHGLSSITPLTISRSVKSWHLTPTILIGSGDLFRDVELLLEDTWKDFRHADDNAEASQLWDQKRADVVLCGATNSGEANTALSFLEIQAKNSLNRVLLLSGANWEVGNRKMLARRCAAKGILILECSDDSKQLTGEIDEFLTSLLENGLQAQTRSAKELLSAWEGFKLGSHQSSNLEERQERCIRASRWILSQFVMDPLAAQSLDALSRTTGLWVEHLAKKDLPTPIAQAVHDLLRLSERSLPNSLVLLQLADKISTTDPSAISPQWFGEIISGLSSIQLRRHFSQKYEEFAALYGSSPLFELKGAS